MISARPLADPYATVHRSTRPFLHVIRSAMRAARAGTHRGRQRTRGIGWLIVLSLAAGGCADNTPSWADRNQRVIDEHHVTGRTRDLPSLSVPTILTDGEPLEREKLPAITIAPGVSATLGWSRGALVERLEMQANASYPSQTLNEELFVIVQDGSATLDVGGQSLPLTR